MPRSRLNDRETRNKVKLDRKQVYLYTDDRGKPEYVELHFGDAYKPMFEKNIQAYSTLPAHHVGHIRMVDATNQILQIDYLGETLPAHATSVTLAIRKLWQIYQENAHTTPFVPLRYLAAAGEFFSAGTANVLAKLNSLLEAENLHALCGYGIDDPVISNFTVLENNCYLVDLDNFQESMSIWQQIGFVIADLDLISKQSPLQTTGAVLLAAHNHIEEDAQNIPLIYGYMSRLAIDVINNHKGLDSYCPEASERSVIAISSELCETFDTNEGHTVREN